MRDPLLHTGSSTHFFFACYLHFPLSMLFFSPQCVRSLGIAWWAAAALTCPVQFVWRCLMVLAASAAAAVSRLLGLDGTLHVPSEHHRGIALTLESPFPLIQVPFSQLSEIS